MNAFQDRRIGCAIIGYGATFNFGWIHARWIQGVPGLRLLAICDKDPHRAAQASKDFPEVDVYRDLPQVLDREDIDLISVVTPHNTHARLAMECLKAGKHTIVEKPMCLNTAEATAMIEIAEEAGKSLAVFHNRRHDGNVRAIKEVIEKGLIGEVFDIQLSACGYGRPGEWWRSRKEVSGGLFYDWGSHAIDWVLSMVPCAIRQVVGFFHKLVWYDVSNEDQTRAIILFENGTVADITQSSIAYAGRPLWRILGTKGAIVDTGEDAIKGYCQELIGPPGGSFKLVTSSGERDVPYMESDWITYYADMASHLLRGTPIPVSGEEGRRVIGVLETAERSAKNGRSERPVYP